LRRCWGRNRNFRRCGRRATGNVFCDDHRLQPIGAVVFLVFTIVAGAASIQSAWFPQFWSKRKPATYRASFGSTLLSQSRAEAGGIWICADHGSGQAMTPVNFATFITIENLHEHPTQVTSLAVDIRGDRGPWVRLLRLDPLPTFSEILCCAPRSSGLKFSRSRRLRIVWPHRPALARSTSPSCTNYRHRIVRISSGLQRTRPAV
jgi:hypothetical protein